MKSEDVLVFAFIGILVWSAILYVIVKNAVESANKKVIQHASVQSKVLMELALKMGVDPEKLDKAERVRNGIGI